MFGAFRFSYLKESFFDLILIRFKISLDNLPYIWLHLLQFTLISVTLFRCFHGKIQKKMRELPTIRHSDDLLWFSAMNRKWLNLNFEKKKNKNEIISVFSLLHKNQCKMITLYPYVNVLQWKLRLGSKSSKWKLPFFY